MKSDENNKIRNIEEKKIEKNIEKDVDPDCQEMMKNFIRNYENDTLTGK